MSKVRINDLARELEVKSRSILDALTAVGVTETKTHSSSIEADEAEKVRGYFKNRRGGGSNRPQQQTDSRPSFNLSGISKPGDALKAILERKQAEADARNAPQRPAAVVVPKPPTPSAPVVARRQLRGALSRCRGRERTSLRRLRRQLRRLRADRRLGR